MANACAPRQQVGLSGRRNLKYELKAPNYFSERGVGDLVRSTFHRETRMSTVGPIRPQQALQLQHRTRGPGLSYKLGACVLSNLRAPVVLR
jgi:hypothetical protein